MISLPSLSQLDGASSTRIWLCTGPTDMRRGFDRLAEQTTDEEQPPEQFTEELLQDIEHFLKDKGDQKG